MARMHSAKSVKLAKLGLKHFRNRFDKASSRRKRSESNAKPHKKRLRRKSKDSPPNVPSSRQHKSVNASCRGNWNLWVMILPPMMRVRINSLLKMQLLLPVKSCLHLPLSDRRSHRPWLQSLHHKRLQ